MKTAVSILLTAVALSLGSAAAKAEPDSSIQPAAGSASAPQQTSEQRARALFSEGNGQLALGRYEEARAKFREAYEAWANPKILLNLATTLRALGRYRDALRAYRHYLESGEPDAARRSEVEAICSQLEQKVARVSLKLDANVLRLSVDGQPVERSPGMSILLDPGRHVLVAQGPSGSEVRELDVEGGSEHTIDLRIVDSRMATPNSDTPEDAGSHEPRHEPATNTRWGILGRIDIDGRAQGGVGALGISRGVASWLQVSGGALIGANIGGWLGLRADLSQGALRPTLSASVPIFVVESIAVGISGAAGLRWQVSDSLSLLVQGGVVHFPSVPDGYEATTFVPSIGSELLL